MLVFNSFSARALAKEKQVHNHYNWKTYGLVNNVVNRNEKKSDFRNTNNSYIISTFVKNFKCVLNILILIASCPLYEQN